MIIPPIQPSPASLPIAILQQIQIVVDHPASITLSDAVQVLCSMQELYGQAATLEQIIQEQVALHLREQQAMRAAHKRIEVIHG